MRKINNIFYQTKSKEALGEELGEEAAKKKKRSRWIGCIFFGEGQKDDGREPPCTAVFSRKSMLAMSASRCFDMVGASTK